MTKEQTVKPIQRIKYEKDMILCSLNLDMIVLPMEQKMWVLSLLKQTFAGQGFKFDDEAEVYWQENENAWQESLRALNPQFKRFAEITLEQAVGPLYEDVNTLTDIISSVYRYENAFDNVQVTRIPSVIYKVLLKPDEMQLKIMNIDDFKDLSPAVKMDWIPHILQMLNYQHAKRIGKPKVDLHKPHVSLRNFAYPGDGVKWKRAVRFDGKDYCLRGLLYDALMRLPNPEQILSVLKSIDEAITYQESKPVQV